MSAPRQASRSQGWNHNLHYRELILEQVNPAMRTALDVGCGEGELAEALSVRGLSVTGLDVNGDVLAVAQKRGCDVTWVQGDVLGGSLEGEQFDLVTAVASIHHLPDFGDALAHLTELVTPGGKLVVLGLGKSSTPMDWAYDAIGAVQHRWYSRYCGYVEGSAPKCFDVPTTYRWIRREAAAVLSGCAFRRLPLFRYLLVWSKS